MRSFSDIVEARGDTAVFTFGRFNPPTTGHEKLIDALAREQGKNAGSKMYVYPSKSQNAKKDPLPYAKKVAYMKKMFPKYSKNITVGTPRTAIEVAVELYKKGHKAIVMVVGSDRVAEFDKLLNEYNGVEGKKHGYYGFDNIEVVSAGERDPDSEGVEGMSASKMRAAAAEGDFDSFKTGVPSGFKDALKLYNDVRKNMGIREERDMGEMTDFETLRDMYLTGKLWNIGDMVEAHGHEGRVINKGTNYLTFVSEDGKVHKTWLHDIVEKERDYKKEYEDYQGKPEQIARRSSRNKARRIMGDKATKDKDVGHKDNNPMNNDPSNLKNEDPSENRREPRLREKTYMRTDNKLKNLKVPVNRKKGKILNPKTGKFEEVNEIRQDPDIKDSPGSEPAKYYAKGVGDKKGMSVSTKKDRDAHFTKGAKMDDDNPAAYKPAPGDAGKKTKPSTHTKKFKQMYGEKEKYDSDKFFGGKGTPEQRLELLKLQNKALRAPGRSPKQNAIKKEINALRKKMGMKVKAEKLGKDATAGDYVKDFRKSDAPQFKGKSKEKKHDMAIAAFLDKKDELKSTKKEEVLDEKIAGLVKKAEKSGMPYGILKKVYDRGMAAWRTGHRPGTTPQQWAFARVNSFTTKSSGTWGKADKDLASKVRGEDAEVDALVTTANAKATSATDSAASGLLKSLTANKKKRKGHEVLGTGGPFQVGEEACCDDCADTTEGLWDNIRKKKERIARGSGEKMRKKGDKGAPTPDQIQRAKSEDLNEWGEVTEKAEYQGKSVELNNPTRGDVKKYKVYVKNDKGNVIKVEFGDPNMSIKRDDPERRKSFRARHNCDQKKDKTTAGYWSCKFWSTKSVTDLMKG